MRTSNVTAVTEVRSTSFGLVSHAQHIFANFVNFLVTWGLLVTIFHSTCLFCVGPYIVRHCISQHCSSIYACTYHLFAGMCHHWWVLFQHCIMLQRLFFIIECGIVHFLCAMRVFISKFGHHPDPLGYLCAKFRVVCHLHCWASPWRKTAYSITQSIAQSPSLFDALGTEAWASKLSSLCIIHSKCA